MARLPTDFGGMLGVKQSKEVGMRPSTVEYLEGLAQVPDEDLGIRSMEALRALGHDQAEVVLEDLSEFLRQSLNTKAQIVMRVITKVPHSSYYFTLTTLLSRPSEREQVITRCKGDILRVAFLPESRQGTIAHVSGILGFMVQCYRAFNS